MRISKYSEKTMLQTMHVSYGNVTMNTLSESCGFTANYQTKLDHAFAIKYKRPVHTNNILLNVSFDYIFC